MTTTRNKAEQRRQDGIEKQRAQIAERNSKNLALAKYEGGTWTFRLDGHGRTWMPTAQRMIAQLAEREGVEAESLSVCIMLPEHGRIFTKNAGTNGLVAHG